MLVKGVMLVVFIFIEGIFILVSCWWVLIMINLVLVLLNFSLWEISYVWILVMVVYNVDSVWFIFLEDDGWKDRYSCVLFV